MCNSSLLENTCFQRPASFYIYVYMKNSFLSFTIPFFLVLISGCSASLPLFEASDQPAAPDYSKETNWSALPFREDAADQIAYGETWVSDSLKKADVFYVYPTIYTKGAVWTADLTDKKLNKRIDNLPVRLQASVFNKGARVYAPRYRQSHVAAFYKERVEGAKALDFAYQDVKMAFAYYLANYNKGRPIILAGHSQGTWHMRKLLKEYFDGTDLQKQLVCAYLVGYAVYTEAYEEIDICEEAEASNCYVAWGSFKDGYAYPDSTNDLLTGNVVVNPITWNRKTDSLASGKISVLLKPQKKKRYYSEVRIHKNMLWVNTKLPFMRKKNNLHLVDYNLYWDSIRENVAVRIASFLKKQN